MSELVRTSTQRKDWAAASFPPLPPSPSWRSLVLQLNHALRDPEVEGLGSHLNYFLDGMHPYFSASSVWQTSLI